MCTPAVPVPPVTSVLEVPETPVLWRVILLVAVCSPTKKMQPPVNRNSICCPALQPTTEATPAEVNLYLQPFITIALPVVLLILQGVASVVGYWMFSSVALVAVLVVNVPSPVSSGHVKEMLSVVVEFSMM